MLGRQGVMQLAPHRVVRLVMAWTFQDLHLITQVSVLDNVMTARPNQRGDTLLGALFHIGMAAEEGHGHSTTQ